MQEEYTFRGQRSDERVIMSMNQHAWLLMPVVYWWLVIIALITAVIVWLGFSGWYGYLIFTLVVIGVLNSIYQYYLWNGGFYIITNQRVIKMDQVTLFYRQISEAEIDRIQEISTDVRGPIKTMLNFGTVKIQTASSSGRLDLDNVPAPYDIQQEIARVQRKVEHEPATSPVLR